MRAPVAFVEVFQQAEDGDPALALTPDLLDTLWGYYLRDRQL